MAAPKPFPVVPPELLARLEEAFPDKVLRLEAMAGADASHVAMATCAQSGQQNVLDLLRHHHEKQQKPDRSL